MLHIAFVAHEHGYINNSPPNNTDKSKKERSRYCGWQDGPFNSARSEQALWRAVITQAMVDATSQNSRRETLFQKMEAIQWLVGGCDDFLEVCQRAELHPDYVRIRAKKALANPGFWRTEAGMSERYEERKYKRELRKKRRHEEAAGYEAVLPLMLQGPWMRMEVAHAH
jgi:hypothetical protein